MYWKGVLQREEETMGAREEHETKGDRGRPTRDRPTRDCQSYRGGGWRERRGVVSWFDVPHCGGCDEVGMAWWWRLVGRGN